jgi:hypothetical protein
MRLTILEIDYIAIGTKHFLPARIKFPKKRKNRNDNFNQYSKDAILKLLITKA